MKILIVGYGSIGSRHARLLAPVANELAIVSSQIVKEHRVFASLAQALHSSSPDYIVISNITSAHADSLNLLKKEGYDGKVLVEKPLFSNAMQSAAPYPFPVHVAYHLRFHPLVVALKKALTGKQFLSAHMYVGQHLSTWRAGRDHKNTYSASQQKGGGVMRDLSHELDMAAYLFGEIKNHSAIAVRAGDVTLDTEDVAAFLLGCAHCPVISVQMNYLDLAKRREWIINTSDSAIKVDLIAQTLAVDGNVQNISCDADDAYRAMHHAMLKDNAKGVCTFDEALALLKLIDTVPITHL